MRYMNITDILKTPVEHLDLSPRTLACLRDDGVRTIADLIARIKPPEIPEHLFDVRVEDLGLSTRTRNVLKGAGVRTVRDLTKRSYADLMQIPGFGQRSFREVVEALARLDPDLPSLIGG